MSKITVLEIHPLRRPRVKQISTYEPLLERELGGLIEVKTPLEDNQNIALICNAESAIQGQSMNRAIGSRGAPLLIFGFVMFFCRKVCFCILLVLLFSHIYYNSRYYTKGVIIICKK